MIEDKNIERRSLSFSMNIEPLTSVIYFSHQFSERILPIFKIKPSLKHYDEIRQLSYERVKENY